MIKTIYATDGIRDNGLTFDTNRLEKDEDTQNQKRSELTKDLFSQKEQAVLQDQKKKQIAKREQEKNTLFSKETRSVATKDISNLFQGKVQTNYVSSAERSTNHGSSILGISYLLVTFLVFGIVLYMSYRMDLQR